MRNMLREGRGRRIDEEEEFNVSPRREKAKDEDGVRTHALIDSFFQRRRRRRRPSLTPRCAESDCALFSRFSLIFVKAFCDEFILFRL